MIPNLIFAVGAFLLAIVWFPAQWGLFERGIGIIILVYVVTRISFATRMLNSGLVQIHEELDEAGYVAGLGTAWAFMRKILIPLVVPHLALFLAVDGAPGVPGTDHGGVPGQPGQPHACR